MSSHGNHGASGAVKTGIVATGASLGTRILHGAARYPVLVFGIGVLAGVYLHKNKKQINDSENCCD